MRVIDILNKVNIEELAENLIQKHNEQFKEKEKTMNILRIFYEDIHSIELEDVSSDEEYSDFTVIVNEIYDDNFLNGENIFDVAEKNRNTGYSFDDVSVNQLEKYFVVDGLHISELMEKKDNIVLDFNEYMKLPSKDFSKHYITSYGLDFIPRKIILACNVADLSIQKFGILTCATEIFWELTFYGWVEEQIQKEASKLGMPQKEDECVPFDMEAECEKFEIDNRDMEFASRFSRKVNEFSHRNIHEFYLELAETLKT